MTEIILGILARAQALCAMRIHAFVFLSNHYHLLLSPTDPQQLARFMCFLNSNLAREAGRLHDWREKLWSRRYQAIPVSSEDGAQIGRLRYILSHGCKEGFVASPAEWPGVQCVQALLEEKPLQGAWFNRTAEYQARRRGAEFDPRDFATPGQVELSPLPCWESLSSVELRGRIADLIREIEEETQCRQREIGSDPLGRDFVLRQNPHERPMHSKRAPAPRFHALTRVARVALLEAYRAFLLAYRSAAEKLRAGDRSACFPEGSFPPPLPFTRAPALGSG